MEYNNPNDAWTQYHDDKEFQDMSEEDMIKAGCWRCLVYIVMAAVAILLSGLIYGCKSVEYVPVIEHRTDTVVKNLTKRDSIYVHDSIEIKQKGDTIWVNRWRTKYVESIKHDSIYVARHDTIPQPYPVDKEVPAELTWWQKTRIIIANVLLVMLAVGGIWLGLSWYLNSRKLLR